MVGICLCLVPVSFLLSLSLSGWLIRASPRWGRVDTPGREAHKGHALSVADTGGLAIFAAVAGPVAAAFAAVWWVDTGSWTGPLAPIADHVAGLRTQTPMGVACLAALLVMHVTGLVDDRRPLGSWTKLAIQLAVAVVLTAWFDVRILEFLGGYGSAGALGSIVLSVLWLVAITNAMNMLDNMDGLAAGVGAIIAAIYLAATLIGGQWFVAALCALLLGALAGFLLFNFPPARLFMGDGGSLVVGLLLGIISVRTTYVEMEPGAGRVLWYGALMPLVVMAVPLYDLSSVILIRLCSGRSPFEADQSHFSHRLVRRGLSKRAAVLLIWLTTVATGLGGVVMLNGLEAWQAVVVAGQTATVLAVLATLERHGS